MEESDEEEEIGKEDVLLEEIIEREINEEAGGDLSLESWEVLGDDDDFDNNYDGNDLFLMEFLFLIVCTEYDSNDHGGKKIAFNFPIHFLDFLPTPTVMNLTVRAKIWNTALIFSDTRLTFPTSTLGPTEEVGPRRVSITSNDLNQPLVKPKR